MIHTCANLFGNVLRHSTTQGNANPDDVEDGAAVESLAEQLAKY